MVVPKYTDAPTPVYAAGPEGGVNGTNVGGAQELIVHKKTNVIRSDTLFLVFRMQIGSNVQETVAAPSETTEQLQGGLGRVGHWESEG